MRKLLIPISVGLMCTSFTINSPRLHPQGEGQSASILTGSKESVDPVSVTAASVYNSICLEQYGLSEEAFKYAYAGYKKLSDKEQLLQDRYLTICDFSQSSKNKRLYILDMESQKLLVNTWVAHGKNSGNEFANRFSNIQESLQSSLGFFITAQTYIGSHGLSLRLRGVEPGYNSNAFDRSIVIHGASYVDAVRAKRGIMMGRSYGCPAVPEKESAQIISIIKNGTCLFIYHPDRNYLLTSKILND